VLITAACAVLVILVFSLPPYWSAQRAEPPDVPGAMRIVAGAPIDAEASVFRIRAGDLAADPTGIRRDDAHPRTLATYRELRAFPGAPPRIPHGLTAEEFRTTRCNTCHERGGYVPRFRAYSPVTPHPELRDCLQCHVADAALVGLELPGPGSEAACRQCHVPEAKPAAAPFASLDWRPPAWPALSEPGRAGGPPAIPHGRQLRGNCLACHAGPGAAAEIRTTHPERANCRQCHVHVADEEGDFVRPAGRR
jgi:nitrate reductase (cytochrome), electron transfer subunit